MPRTRPAPAADDDADGSGAAKRGRARWWTVASLIGVLALALGLTRPELADADAGSLPLAAPACAVGTTAQPHYDHVIWIWMENHSYQQVVGSGRAPFENSLARHCGLAADYHAVQHPSLPNYLAATGGSTFGVTHDAAPGPALISAPSIFSEVQRAGLQWRVYVESMKGNCQPAGPHGFARNPVAYYASSRRTCARWDVPLGTPSAGHLATALRTGHLPAFSMVIPNRCDSTHSCPVGTGDAWLSRWIDTIVRSPAYRRGDTAVFLTWDEGKRDIGQHVPLIVVSPTTRPGTVSAHRFDHLSLLRTTTDLLHLAAPGSSGRAASLASTFGL